MELKDLKRDCDLISSSLFLIHRVELKEYKHTFLKSQVLKVSNSPCGVESNNVAKFIKTWIFFVSNSPCGVESLSNSSRSKNPLPFLIHRVELKVKNIPYLLICIINCVSNSPCGVGQLPSPLWS